MVESLDEIESDDANLMAKEFSMVTDIDPLSLPEMHEHMIRSPPPTTWPHSPNKRNMFEFPNCDETLQVEVTKVLLFYLIYIHDKIVLISICLGKRYKDKTKAYKLGRFRECFAN